MKICFFFSQWLNFIKSRLSNTFAAIICPDVPTPWRNEVTRLMRISVVRGTQREKTATVTLVQNDLWACLAYVWYTLWSRSCKICLVLQPIFASYKYLVSILCTTVWLQAHTFIRLCFLYIILYLRYHEIYHCYVVTRCIYNNYQLLVLPLKVKNSN